MRSDGPDCFLVRRISVAYSREGSLARPRSWATGSVGGRSERMRGADSPG